MMGLPVLARDWTQWHRRSLPVLSSYEVEKSGEESEKIKMETKGDVSADRAMEVILPCNSDWAFLFAGGP